jgi:hypothetical protein
MIILENQILGVKIEDIEGISAIIITRTPINREIKIKIEIKDNLLKRNLWK